LADRYLILPRSSCSRDGLHADVPEILKLLGHPAQDPNDVMCASSRMVVKRKAPHRCAPLHAVALRSSFRNGRDVDTSGACGWRHVRAWRGQKLCHPHCAKFCVLGGGSCSA
jgi:hypothetical protein